jgi:hypothetical protein
MSSMGLASSTAARAVDNHGIEALAAQERLRRRGPDGRGGDGAQGDPDLPTGAVSALQADD